MIIADESPNVYTFQLRKKDGTIRSVDVLVPFISNEIMETVKDDMARLYEAATAMESGDHRDRLLTFPEMVYLCHKSLAVLVSDYQRHRDDFFRLGGKVTQATMEIYAMSQGLDLRDDDSEKKTDAITETKSSRPSSLQESQGILSNSLIPSNSHIATASGENKIFEANSEPSPPDI